MSYFLCILYSCKDGKSRHGFYRLCKSFVFAHAANVMCKNTFARHLRQKHWVSRVQHRLCPSRFPPLFCASSRHPAQRDVSIPIPPACTCQHAIDVNVTGRLDLKRDRKHFVLLSNKRKYTGNKILKPAINCGGSK